MCRNGRAKAADTLLSAPGGLGSTGMTCERLCACSWEGPGGGRWPAEAAGVASGPLGRRWTPAGRVVAARGWKGVGLIYPGSGSSKLFSGTLALAWESPTGRQGRQGTFL